MKKVIMHWFMLFIFASKILHIIGKVTLLRGSSIFYKSPNQLRLICLSENDDGALVWNYNLIVQYYELPKNDFEFHDFNNDFNNNEINCKMNAEENCLALWRRDGWNLTDSIKTPMGPVFDQRWEEFKEYKNFEDTYDYISQLPITLTLSFSVRTSRDAHILICNGPNYNKDYCYWIIIGGWGNTLSVIRKCANGVPEPGKWPISGSECDKAKVKYKHTPLSENEWRSFILSWDAIFRRIEIYDTDEIIMSYNDMDRNKRSNYDYHMFIRSPTKMLFRFHTYNFLHTNVETATLLSPAFQFNNEPICIQLLIGLCNECNAHILLRDSTTHETLEMITVKGSSKAKDYDLPMWQSVKIKSNFSANNYRSVIIQLIPKLTRTISNPLWAIANVRQCPKNEALRKGILNYKQDWDNNGRFYFWPKITCQKLFYDEHTIVSATSRLERNIELDNADCLQDKIGPQCLLSCERDLNSNVDCQNIAICYENGCTCAPGFWEERCSKPCTSNTYGHGCKKICGLCNGSCNKITGACSEGCNNYKKTYIPPMCQISIDKPSIPVITSTNETTISVIVPMIWKDEYDNISIFYFFDIKGHMQYNVPHSWNRVFRNMTQLIGFFQNLEPGAIYQISCNLLVENELIYGDWEIVETKCNPADNFIATPGETDLVINWDINSHQLHPCPKSWYYLIVRNINTNEEVSELNMYFPYKLQRLPSYTNFNVTIYHKNYQIFTQEIRTLEGVPSKVLDFQRMLINTELTLIWRPPSQPNGKIIRYEVILKIRVFYGCKDLKLATPNNHIINVSTTDTMITIPDLRPYTSYSAQVVAHNSRHFSMIEEKIFDTAQSEIPSETFSQLRVQDWKLMWNAPEDCSTITGSMIARIKIRGISNAVKDFEVIKQTTRYFLELDKLKLNGVERYEVKIYVIRGYSKPENTSAYRIYEFESPPTAPPSVSNLEVVEIDTRRISTSEDLLYLRWQSPLPPLNGKLRDYGIQSCYNTYYNEHCKIIANHFNTSCDLWDDYICKDVPITTSAIIQVFAYNVNVTEPGALTSVTEEMLRNTTPDAPGNYTFIINDNSVIDLKWLHPWKTGGHLQYFRIQIEETSSNLRRRVSRSPMNKIYKYPVTQYMRNYETQLYLFSSTKYIISIQAATVDNKFSTAKFVEFYTPSTAKFDSDLDVMVQESDSTILLNIPSVLNDTQDSIMHIIVKGPNPCDQHLKVPEYLRARAGVKMYEIAWQAAEISTNELAGKLFIVGDNKIYGNAKNCPLKPNEVYEIVIIVIEQNLSSKPIMLIKSIRLGMLPPIHHEMWLIPLILFFVVAGIAFYFYRRKKQKSTKQFIQDEMVLSQNIENYEHETRSTVSNSKQDLSTPSDRQSLSRASTPEIQPIAIINDETKREKMESLVKVKDFEDYVKQAIESGLLDKQYETFPRGQTRSWDYGKLPQNKTKNRYGNLIAYDETRVILKKFPNDKYSDYINANYITGYKKDKHYIATQGPKPNTVVDFWRMIWQENVLIICMLTNVVENGKTKCEQYWPDIGKKKKYGDIIVLNARHNVFADYCLRTFHVTYGEETRKIEHLHYTAWPDHGVPMYTHSVVTYLKKLLATPPGNGPVVVHCSAGVGRTGTIILCDICLHRAAAEGLLDVFAETASIRNERANMVDNKQQYLLAHLTLVECLLSIPTTLPCNDMLPTRIKELKKQLPIQQQRLQNTAWQDEALRPFTSPPSLSERNRAKNRFPELISNKVNRIYLKRYPASDEDSDYLSAVYVDGVKLQNQYLASQLPMPSTINDFWRMIAEFKVELILMLQPPDLQDPTCCAIAPVSGEFKPVPYLNITANESVEMEYYTSQKLLLVDNSEKPSREQSVTILCLTEWKSGKDQPPPPVMTMVTLWQAAERIARGDGPTVTLCHDGITGCGLYLALSFLLERMAVERECDVCLAVRAVRRSRPDFVRSLEHLEYLYDAAVTYLEYFETYANFS
ncbi:hypothetical protein P5V15_006601 [Pogonomyrmex californicus]